MESAAATVTAAAGKDPTGKVDDLGVLDVSAVQVGKKRKMLLGSNEVKDPAENNDDDPEEKGDKDTEEKEGKEDAPVLDEQQVSGWNPGTGTTIREDQKVSQGNKAEVSASKKGLGYFCYGTHGAVRPKF